MIKWLTNAHLHVEHVEGGALREARKAEVDSCKIRLTMHGKSKGKRAMAMNMAMAMGISAIGIAMAMTIDMAMASAITLATDVQQ